MLEASESSSAEIVVPENLELDPQLVATRQELEQIVKTCQVSNQKVFEKLSQELEAKSVKVSNCEQALSELKSKFEQVL